MGYISIPRLQDELQAGRARDSDTVDTLMVRFQRKVAMYHEITPNTPLEELEAFFDGDARGRQDFAVVTDGPRRLVIGVVTRADLEEFVKRRGV